jgi:hypothetical protein
MAEIGRRMTLRQAEARRKRLGVRRNPVTLAENVTEAVQEIHSGPRRFRLHEPINLTVRHSGPYCFVGYPALEIEGYGTDEQEALEAFADVFAATWDSYADENQDRLTRDAQELGQRLRDLVAEAESI